MKRSFLGVERRAGSGGGFRQYEFLKNMGFNLKGDAEAYSFHNFVKEIFFDSETSMIVISGVPTKEKPRDEAGKVLEGADRSRAGLPSWLMAKRKKDLNDLAGCQRSLSQGNCAPNRGCSASTKDFPINHARSVIWRTPRTSRRRRCRIRT